MSACDCEPTVHDDGSVTHEQDCEVYPWCPHEAGEFSCFMPCGCRCGPCRILTTAHAAPTGPEPRTDAPVGLLADCPEDGAPTCRLPVTKCCMTTARDPRTNSAVER